MKCTAVCTTSLMWLIQLLDVTGIAAQDCDLKKVSKGVSVYTCERSDSELNAIRALFDVKATLSHYAATVLNIDEYKFWNYEANNARLLNQISDTELIYYTEALAPWPVTDRYVVLRLKVTQDPESKILTITLNNIPDLIPEKKGFVMVKEYRSVLEVTPGSAGYLQIKLDLNIDPGGNVPDWVTNIVATRIPVNTYSNLKKYLESNPDVEHLFSSISNH